MKQKSFEITRKKNSLLQQITFIAINKKHLYKSHRNIKKQKKIWTEKSYVQKVS